MCGDNVVGLAKPGRAISSGNDRLLAELDDLSLYKLVRRARREGIRIRQPQSGDPAKTAAPGPQPSSS